MKKEVLKIFILATFMLSVSFVSAWTFQITTTSSPETFSFQINNPTNFYINWGDGDNDTYNEAGLKNHSFSTAGTYNISVTGYVNRISFSEGTEDLLVDILTNMSDGLTGINNAGSMFAYADNITSFTNEAWFEDVSKNVTDMDYMFYRAHSFNQNLSNWNTSNVQDMSNMFQDATAFNGNVSNWDVGSATDMEDLFRNATSFNQDIGNWDTSKVTTTEAMFLNADLFNQDIGNWDVSNVTQMRNMFQKTDSFNQNLTGWNTSKIADMSYMFWEAAAFNGNISNWITGSVTTMYYMFSNSILFNQDIGSWNTTSVTTMESMFEGASSFNQNLSNWDTGNVAGLGMFRMFRDATSFNGNISNWNISSITSMKSMFEGVIPFDQNINNWDVGSVTTMESMFEGASSFNQNLTGWNTSSLTGNGIYRMFRDATSFNGNISNWDVSGVTNLHDLFYNATSFNQDIGSWDVSGVTSMESMFEGASAFNQDIGSWDTGSVAAMHGTFRNTTSFNQNLSNWNTSEVTDMSYMFANATSFNQDIGSWDVGNIQYLNNFFDFVTLSTLNYDSLLKSWSSLTPDLQDAVSFSGGNSQYCSGGLARNNTLIGIHSWDITDGGMNASCDPTAPNVSIISPTNTTYDSSTVWFNLSANDTDSSISSCWYSLNGAANISLSNSSDIWFTSKSGLTSEDYNLKFYCNNTDGYISDTEQVNFTINIEEEDDDPAPSSGSSGSSPTTVTKEWTNTIIISDEEFKEGYTEAIAIKTRVKIKIKGEEHYVGVKNISTKKIILEIASTPMNVTFEVGNEKKFELTNDGYYDLYVKLNSIEGNNANLTILEINELIPQELAPEDEEKKSLVSKEEISNTQWEMNDGKFFWFFFLIALVVVFIAVFYRIKRNKTIWKREKSGIGKKIISASYK